MTLGSKGTQGARSDGGQAGTRRDGPGANRRLTASVAVVLLVLLAAEGFTILQVGRLLTPHVFIGMLLVPPVLLKMGSTVWRFSRYYLGNEAYRRNGPPLIVFRLLGPVVIILTAVVFATGIALLLGPQSVRTQMLELHKVSFVLWFGVMTIHVLGHIAETARVAPRDWMRRTRHQVDGATARQWVLALSLVLGLVLAIATVPHVGPWLDSGRTGVAALRP